MLVGRLLAAVGSCKPLLACRPQGALGTLVNMREKVGLHPRHPRKWRASIRLSYRIARRDVHGSRTVRGKAAARLGRLRAQSTRLPARVAQLEDHNEKAHSLFAAIVTVLAQQKALLQQAKGPGSDSPATIALTNDVVNSFYD